MFKPLYTEKNLAQHFRVGDSGRWKVDLEKDIEIITKSAAARAIAEPPELVINCKTDQTGKKIFCAADIETDLILRATYRRLLNQCNVHLPSREDIVNGIVEATSEACPYLVTRCDIKSFYESLDAEPIVRQLLIDTRTDPRLKAVLRQIYCDPLISKSIAPRGLAISTIFAEIALRDFDNVIRKAFGVHRYFRFADDIIIFSLPEVDVLSVVENELAKLDLKLNEKTEVCPVKSVTKTSDPLPIAKYTYLGYEFATHEKIYSFTSREFDISICEMKLKKRKTRMFLALQAFKRDGDHKLLIDRLNYLSTNQSVYKTRHTRGARKQKVGTGIHYNYPRCGHYPALKSGRVQKDHNAYELIAMDVVLQNALWGKRSEFSADIKSIPPQRQSELKRISFAQGYKKKISKRFTRQRVAQICKVWGND